MTTQVDEKAIQGAAAITPSDATAIGGDTVYGRQIAIVCGTAGNVKLRLYDGTTIVFPVAVGFTVLPWAVTQVFVTLTTAVATYYNLR